MSHLRRIEVKVPRTYFPDEVVRRAFAEAHQRFVQEYCRAPRYADTHFTGCFTETEVVVEIVEETDDGTAAGNG